jgi:thiol-disulfide isomerase/thioredoxin
MTLKLLAVSTSLIGFALTGAAIPGLCNEATPPVKMAAVSQASAPDFAGINNWFNSKPLSMADLRGKVVLVNFWTYGCVNCVNTLPHVTALYAKYKDKGLVVVGVHTPEFPFERSASNVQAALKRHGITYPVAQDNDSKTWTAYSNQYWPAQYIVDQSGKIVFQHAGEGRYDEIERTVARLLNASS